MGLFIGLGRHVLDDPEHGPVPVDAARRRWMHGATFTLSIVFSLALAGVIAWGLVIAQV